jgi:RNA polymerase sigma-70 factor (ECF subfamily)
LALVVRPPEQHPGHDPAAETDLLARLRRGEAEAYEAMVRIHGPRMLGTARHLLRRDEDARDAVQEAFISAFRGLCSFHGECRLSTWLHRITVNAALMRLRSRPAAEESIDALLPRFVDDGHHALHPAEWTAPADALVERRENREFVRGCIDRLPDHYRSVLLLRDLGEMTTEEVAQALGVTPGLVKVRLHRARQALRTLIEPRFRRGPI